MSNPVAPKEPTSAPLAKSHAVAVAPGAALTETPTSPASSFRPVSTWQKILGIRLLWPLLALILLLAYNLLFTPGFFHVEITDGHFYGSLINILAVGAPTAILAIGMTLVIATGGVDLSVGSVMALGGSIVGLLIAPRIAQGTEITGYGWAFFPAAIVSLLICIGIGVLNGVLVSIVRIQPIIATLIVMVAGRGIAQLVTSGQKINFSDHAFVALGNGYLFYLPLGVTLVAIVLIVAAVATRQTGLGLALESVGDSPTASRYVGLRVTAITVFVYAMSGLCSAIAGLVAASRISTADPLNIGATPPMELEAIFAVVVGGTALTGGRFTLAGSILGALLLQALGTTLLSTKFFGHDISPELLPLPKAIVIVVVCLLQSTKFRDAVLKPFRHVGKKAA